MKIFFICWDFVFVILFIRFKTKSQEVANFVQNAQPYFNLFYFIGFAVRVPKKPYNQYVEVWQEHRNSE